MLHYIRRSENYGTKASEAYQDFCKTPVLPALYSHLISVTGCYFPIELRRCLETFDGKFERLEPQLSSIREVDPYTIAT